MSRRKFECERREFLAGGLAAALGVAGGGLAAAQEKRPEWKWKLLVPHGKPDDESPSARDPWNGMLSHEGSLYLFGGAPLKYGPAKRQADLTVVGTVNDLWRYDLARYRWTRLEADDGRSGFDAGAQRPCGRVLPAWVPLADKFYLFGGTTILGAGWKPRVLNDFWRYDPKDRSWELLEPDDGRELQSPTHADAPRPATTSAMGVATIGSKIYSMAGWGRAPDNVLSSQLWSYDVEDRKWELLGTGRDQPGAWPAERYCPAMTSFSGKLFLWGGRESVKRKAGFYYSDLWSYDPARRRWEKLSDGGPDAPRARYGMGQARVGDYWYIFGGFGAVGSHGPQLNDLWRLDLGRGEWTCVEPDNGSKDMTATAVRPGLRRIPAMCAAGDSIYIFGGFDLTSGPNDDGPLVAFNDLWKGTPA